MAWEEKIFVDIPGVSPSEVPGFVQWVDLSSANAWIAEAVRRCSEPVWTGLQGKPWADVSKALQGCMDAISQVYRAINLEWVEDPIAAELYRSWWGQFLPKDPDPPCTEIPTGPNVVWTGLIPEWQLNPSGLPRTPEEIRAAFPGLLTERVGNTDSGGMLVADAPKRTIVGAKLWDLWHAMKGANAEFPICVVPMFLSYKSRPVTRLQQGAADAHPAATFDGVYTGAGRGTTEVSTTYAAWDLDCWRWDDAPFNRPRVLPPLRWSLEYMRAWAAKLQERGAWQTAVDTRTNSILINLDRVRYYELDSSMTLSEELARSYKERNTQRWQATEGKTNLQTSMAVVCGIATAAGGVGGLACAAASGVVNLVLGLVPNAVGCNLDGWGRAMPFAVQPQLSILSPPSFNVPPPPPPPYDPNVPLTVFPTLVTAMVMPLAKVTDPVVKDNIVKANANANDPTKNAPTASSSGSGALVIGALGIGLALMLKGGRRGR